MIEFILYICFWLSGFMILFQIRYCKKPSTFLNSQRKISVIIPARNEENSLPLLLTSLRQQKIKPEEIIVVDDNSSDRTDSIAEKEGAIVIKSGQLPTGWQGKTWACYQGAKKATNEILLFLDADTMLEENGLEKIIDTYGCIDGVLSIQPFHRISKAYEQLSAFFNIIQMAAMGAFTILGNRIKPLGLFGPTVLISKDLYKETGGHESVKGEVVEDLAYGSKLKKSGVNIYCFGGKDSISFRMYPGGIKALIEGWSKGLATGARNTPILLLIIIVAWIIGAGGTAVDIVQSAVFLDFLWLTIWGILYCCYAVQIYWMLHRIGNFSFLTAVLYVVPLVFFILVFAYSLFLIFLRGSVFWKGRSISIKNRDYKK